MQDRSRGSFMLIAMLASILLASCGSNGTSAQAESKLTFTYGQVGACDTFSKGKLASNAGPHAAYIIFSLQEFDNSQSAIDFPFDPSKLYIYGTKQHADTTLNIGQYVDVQQATPTTIMAGSDTMPNTYVAVTITTTNTDGAAEANLTSYFLLYDGAPSDLHIYYSKANNDQVKWPNTMDCADIAYM